MRHWIARLMASWLVLLASCGGGEEDVGARRMAAAMHAQPRAAVMEPGTFVFDASTLFDWAEWKYPDLFPKGPRNIVIVHEGFRYTIRAYANGNYLGVRHDYVVYGLGPFTGHVLRSFGAQGEYVDYVRADACPALGLGCSAPVIDAQPLAVHTSTGRAVSFSVAAASRLPVTYQWQVSVDGGVTFADVPAAVGASFSLSSAAGSADDGRHYRVRVANAAGITTSRAVLLMVRSGAWSAPFPVDPGSRWVYARSDGEAPDIVQVAGTQNVEGGTGTTLETIDGRDGSRSSEVYVVTGDGVRQYAASDGDAFARAIDGMQLLRLPLHIGESSQEVDRTVDSGIDVDGDGVADRLHVVATSEVVGIETLTTPAARFDSVLHQRYVIVSTLQPSSGVEPLAVRGVADVWYADGVGQVRWTVRNTAPGLDETITRSLEAFRVGARRSDVTPPSMRSVSPEGAIASSTNVLSATFDERIDPASVTTDALQLVDNQGRRLAGTARVRDTTLWFSTEQALTVGTYTARLAPGLRDLAGNELGPGRTWTFTIDMAAPSILSITPADGARDVPLSASMVIEFSEPPLPSSIDRWGIFLYDGNQPVPVSYAVDGSRVTVTPDGLLPSATNLRLTVQRITDHAGNALVGSAISEFRTQQGRFAPAMPLGAELVHAFATAVGDVNGDGLPDVLASPDPEQTGVLGALHVLYGQPDRTLRAPQKLVLDPLLSRCAVTSIAIGDLSGDGRADVIAGAGGCGAQVLLQSAIGTLLPGELLGGSATRVRIADLDGNGKPVLITAGEPELRIWRRDAAGRLQPSAPLNTGLTRHVDVVVSDVNGDGRPDIVLAGGDSLRGVVLLVRRSDGSFAQPRYLSTVQGVPGIGVADFNGDGRVDIVASGGGNSPTALTLFHQGADGGFGPLTDLTTYDSPGRVAIADVDRDGRADIVVSHGSWRAVGVYLRRADGTLAPEERYAAPACNGALEHLAVGDVDGDGRPDILMCGTLLRQLPTAAAGLRASGAPTIMRAAVDGVRRSLRVAAAASGRGAKGGSSAAR